MHLYNGSVIYKRVTYPYLRYSANFTPETKFRTFYGHFLFGKTFIVTLLNWYVKAVSEALNS